MKIEWNGYSTADETESISLEGENGKDTIMVFRCYLSENNGKLYHPFCNYSRINDRVQMMQRQKIANINVEVFAAKYTKIIIIENY